MIKWNFDIEKSDALIIVPPFASTNMPSLAVHILQACALKRGQQVKIFYANLAFAAEIGRVNYEAISRAPVQYLLGERLFCSPAYGLSPFGNDDFLRRLKNAHVLVNNNNINIELKISELSGWEQSAHAWVDEIASRVVSWGFPIIGFTTTFEQTAASIAILNRIKSLAPHTVTIMGGANCEGEMAEGISSLNSYVDYIFSGESETVFPEFLTQISNGSAPQEKVIRGAPCMNLDDIPVPDYSEFFSQRKVWLGDKVIGDEKNLRLPYETSRGCWWGRIHHCTFCGLNGETTVYRQKSADRVISDLQTMVSCSPTRQICMSDNIMPFDYFKTVLPRIPQELPDVSFFYELKANLSLREMLALKQAGVNEVQPGIESLSSECLRLMGKGVNARQNINLLRYARSVSISLGWNILYALPGDKLSEYQDMLTIIHLLRHLQPPLGVSHLSLERFSPYFENQTDYNIKNVRPLPAYYAVFPAHADVARLAYHFEGDYDSESKRNSEQMKEFDSQIEEWREAWRTAEELPTLALSDLGDDRYLLLDTRGLRETQELRLLDERQARLILIGNPQTAEDERWALEHNLAINLDGHFMPLTTADPTLFEKFSNNLSPIYATKVRAISP